MTITTLLPPWIAAWLMLGTLMVGFAVASTRRRDLQEAVDRFGVVILSISFVISAVLWPGYVMTILLLHAGGFGHPGGPSGKAPTGKVRGKKGHGG